ncbi:MAG TPA: DUF2142 domain-containing protein [Actinomycetes bacterium]
MSTDTGERGGNRSHVLLMLFFGSLSLVWVFITPIGAVPDEPAHVFYAAGVVRGQLGSGPSGHDLFIPTSVFTNVSDCYATQPSVPLWTCTIPWGPDTIMKATSAAAHYPPLYYALVGAPTLLPFGPPAWYLMRLLSVALSLVLVGLPLWLFRHRPTNWLVVGTLAALAPVFVSLAASVNPNGAETAAAAGMCLSAGFLFDSLRRGNRRDTTRAAASLAATSAYLALARPASFVEMVGLGVGLALLAPPTTWATVRRHWRHCLAWALIPATALAVSLLYTRWVGAPGGAATTGSGQLAEIGTNAWAMSALLWWYLVETFGILGWRDYSLPGWLEYAGLTAMLTPFAIGLVAGRWWQRLGLCVLALGALVVGPLAVGMFVFGTSWSGYQGRYALPLIVALPIAGAAVAHLAGVTPRQTGRTAAAGLVWLVALLHFWGWWMTVIRYGSGLPLFDDKTSQVREFHWYHGWLLTSVIAVGVLLSAASAYALWRSLRTEPGWPHAAGQEVPLPGRASEADFVTPLART